MKVGVFLHGTAIMHAAAAGVERDERVQQVRRRDPTVRDFASYIPTPGTAAKLAAGNGTAQPLSTSAPTGLAMISGSMNRSSAATSFRPGRCTAAATGTITGR